MTSEANSGLGGPGTVWTCDGCTGHDWHYVPLGLVSFFLVLCRPGALIFIRFNTIVDSCSPCCTVKGKGFPGGTKEGFPAERICSIIYY